MLIEAILIDFHLTFLCFVFSCMFGSTDLNKAINVLQITCGALVSVRLVWEIVTRYTYL